MQSMVNLHGFRGLPLCVSGIGHPLTLSKEMADHDRRRENIKRQRSQAREELHASQETNGLLERVLGEIRGDEVDGDLAGLLHDLAHCYLGCTAKAA